MQYSDIFVVEIFVNVTEKNRLISQLLLGNYLKINQLWLKISAKFNKKND